MLRPTLLLAVFLAVGATAAAAPPRVAISRPPQPLHVRDTWTATVTVRNVRPRAFVGVSGRRRVGFPLERVGRRYRAFVSFPTAGLWRYGVRVERRTIFAGSVNVRPFPPLVRQPFGVLEEPERTVLVADWDAGIVYRLDLAHRDGVVLTRVPAPRDLKWAPDRSHVLVASARAVLELDRSTGTTRRLATAEASVGGIDSDGEALYVNEDGARVVRIGPDGGRSVLADGLDGVHGLLVTPEGLVVCESFAGRVLLIRGGRVEVLASGLGNPSYAARASDGSLYVTEFLAGRVTRLDPSGGTTPVADVSQPGPISFDRDGRLLVGTLGGTIVRVDATNGRAVRVYP